MQHFHNSTAPTGSKRALKATKTFGIALVFALIAACGDGDGNTRVSNQDLRISQNILADAYGTELAFSPETVTRAGLRNTQTQTSHYNLSDHSQAGFERRRLTRIELLQRLQNRPILPETLALETDLRIATQTLQHVTDLEQMGHGRYSTISTHPYVIDPYSGIWIEGLSLLETSHRIENKDDASAYIVRLRLLADAIDDTRRRLIADEAAGYALPKPLLAETLDKLSRLLTNDAAQLEPLISTLSNLTLGISDISALERTDLITNARLTLQNRIIPAYASLAGTLEAMSETAPQQAGLWNQPSGYLTLQKLIRFHLTDDLSLEQTHAQNLRDATSYRESLELLLSASAEIEEPLSFQEALALFYLPPEETSLLAAAPAEAPQPERLIRPVSDLNALLMNAENLPRPLRNAIEHHSSTAQQRPKAPDQSGTLFPHIAIAYAIEQLKSDTELQSLPKAHLRLIETLAATADSGLNHAKWSFEQTSGYIAEHSGLPIETTDQITLWVASNPGYELSKAAAYRRLKALAARASAVLGQDYDQAAFIAVVKGDRPRPLALIEADVERWYAAQLNPAG